MVGGPTPSKLSEGGQLVGEEMNRVGPTQGCSSLSAKDPEKPQSCWKGLSEPSAHLNLSLCLSVQMGTESHRCRGLRKFVLLESGPQTLKVFDLLRQSE